MTLTVDDRELDHERIWLQPKCCAGEYDGRQWCQDNVFDDGECEDGNKATEYVRADRLQSLLSERGKLREALEEADFQLLDCGPPDRTESIRQVIRAALRSTDNG